MKEHAMTDHVRSVIITRTNDGFSRIVHMRNKEVLAINRSFVAACRKPTVADTFVSERNPCLLIRHGETLLLRNPHSNSVYVVETRKRIRLNQETHANHKRVRFCTKSDADGAASTELSFRLHDTDSQATEYGTDEEFVLE